MADGKSQDIRDFHAIHRGPTGIQLNNLDAKPKDRRISGHLGVGYHRCSRELIVADIAPKTVTIDLEDGLLVEGENTITFVFANAFEGTTGFFIVDVKILMNTSAR